MELGNSQKSILGLKEKKDKYEKISYNIDLSNPDNAHVQIINNVSDNSTVLDYGCAGGVVGEFLHKNKNCNVYGVEIDEEAIKTAKSRKSKPFKEIYNFNIDKLKEGDDYTKFQKDKILYDYVLFIDVLEHLQHPENAIKLIVQKLKPQGKILVSIPNITHENIICNLLDGNFNYADLGLLDNTHLRFFTQNSFLDFIDNINEQLHDFKLECNVKYKTQARDYDDCKQNKPLLDLMEHHSDLYTLQFIFEITKVDAKDFKTNTELQRSDISISTLYENLVKERVFLNSLLFEKRQELENKNWEIQNLNASLLDLQTRNIAIEQENKDLQNTLVYKMLKFLRILKSIILKIFPCRKLFTVLKKILKKVIKYCLLIIKHVLKFCLYILPSKELKRKITNKIHNSKEISKILGIEYYPDLGNMGRLIIDKKTTEGVFNQTSLDKTIGIHLHLFYTDLLDEFYNYFRNIPYKFDLFVSVPQGSNKWKIKNKFSKILNADKVIVKECPNIGRDFGPMFVLFNDDLKKYDYIMHVHSKKSLRTGTSQDDWRNYLLRFLLGDREKIMKHFWLMENKNVGLVYPDTHKSLAIFCHTWLGAANLAKEHLPKLGMQYEDKFLDFSAGSMFWARKDAIADLFNLNFTWEDFGEEKGQTDGTLPYLFERIFPLQTIKNGFHYAVFNEDNNSYQLDYAHKNIEQYNEWNADLMFQALNHYDIITFDIFDTLITRKIYHPDDVFALIGNELEREGIMKSKKYFKLRKKAELNVRKEKNFVGDCNIHEIYENFSKISKLNKTETNDIKNREIKMELEMAIPRKDVLEVYNKLLENNKQIILISDMYLTKDIIEEMLHKCGYYNYFDILLSSETGYRKDNGTMWDYFFSKYNNSLCIHVGDNEESDIHSLIKREKNQFYIIQGKKLAEVSNYNLKTKDDINVHDSVLLGLLYNKIYFNSPFALHHKFSKSIIHNLKDYGYAVLGPIFLQFFIWFFNNIGQDETLLFLAREGYFLQKFYNYFKEKFPNSKLHNIENLYFIASRRALTVPNIQNTKDIRNILNSNYSGTIRELMFYKLGVIANNKLENITINLPQDSNLVMRKIKQYIPEILENAKKEKENYMKYIEQNIPDYKNKNLSVVDLGYSGTIQFELTKLLKQKVSGYYFVVSNNLKPISQGCKVYSCFNEVKYDDSFNKNPISKYSLLLESFLTAPQGQLINFDENAIPNYLLENNKESSMKKLSKIYKGIIELFDDLYKIFGSELLSLDFDTEIISKNLENFVINTDSLPKEFEDVFNVENLYCLNNNTNAFQVYKK